MFARPKANLITKTFLDQIHLLQTVSVTWLLSVHMCVSTQNDTIIVLSLKLRVSTLFNTVFSKGSKCISNRKREGGKK